MLEMPKQAEPEDIEETDPGARRCGRAGTRRRLTTASRSTRPTAATWSRSSSRHTANRRDDEWGGTLEHRMRFLKEIIKRIRAAVGEDFVVGMQLAADEYTPHGLTLPRPR